MTRRTVLVALVALIHVYIVVLEMVLWTTPSRAGRLRHEPEFAEQTKVLAANQGLYNGFLVAGLVLGPRRAASTCASGSWSSSCPASSSPGCTARPPPAAGSCSSRRSPAPSRWPPCLLAG